MAAEKAQGFEPCVMVAVGEGDAVIAALDAPGFVCRQPVRWPPP